LITSDPADGPLGRGPFRADAPTAAEKPDAKV
ncbi:MAG: hypothetical protein JWO46_1243, partial [Nocardioidaceae bacterium]|nr:hypothetical protein [Nocardioidaceae bacterium]